MRQIPIKVCRYLREVSAEKVYRGRKQLLHFGEFRKNGKLSKQYHAVAVQTGNSELKN